jgi:ABC-type branched-subunit amino acid transport system permease subunit
VNNHWPYVLAVLIGAVASMVVACLIGIPALRLRGVNLAIVTLATSVAIGTLVLNQFNSGNGYNMPQPSVAGHQLQGRTLVIVSLALVAIVAAVLYWIRTSWYGKRILALRTSERAANAVGIPAFRYKLIVFSGGGFLAGIGGSLWASGVGVINATSFDPLTSIMLLSFAYINGVGSITAGIIAGMAVALGSPFMTNVLHVNGFGWFNVIGGVGLIWTLIVHPNGALVRVPHSRNGKATEAPHRGRRLEALRPGRPAEALQQERTAKTEAL